MNRVVKLILLVALVLTVVVPMSGIFAQGGGELPIKQGTIRTRTGTAALFAEPDINSEIVGQIDGGATVMIYEESGRFVRVDGGWTFAANFNLAPAQVNYQSAVDTRRTDLAIRSEASISAEVIKTLPAGTLVGVMVIDGLWAQVYDGEVVGWAFLADLAPVPATADLADLVQTNAVTAGRRTDIAFRAAPDLTSEVVAVVPAGSAAHILAYDGQFALAMLEDGVVGWTFRASLTAEARAYARGTLNAGPVNFRETSGGTVLNSLPFGANLLLLGRNTDGTWLQVKYSGSLFIGGESVDNPTGWVSTDYVDTEYDVMMLPVTAAEEETVSAVPANIIEAATAAGNFTALLTAVEAAGLTEMLMGEGPYTVFAPSDEVFAALPAGTLEAVLADPDMLMSILQYHVVEGQLLAADIAGMTTIMTVGGAEITVTVGEDGSVTLNGDTLIVVTDIQTGNGVIHVIAGVLVP